MRAVVLAGPEDLRVESVPEPVVQDAGDAIVRVTGSAVCGADLFPYHGFTPGFENGTILGHEFVGVVEEVGPSVTQLQTGDRVVNTSMTSDGSCAHCRAGRRTQCESRALFGYSGVYPRLEGGQADLVRIPFADRCLWRIPDEVSDEDAVFLADMLPTGHGAVRRGGVGIGDVVVVLGLGCVGLMATMVAAGTARKVIAVDGIAERRDAGRELRRRRGRPGRLGGCRGGGHRTGWAPTSSSRRPARRQRWTRRCRSSVDAARCRSSGLTSSPTIHSTTR